MTKFFLFFLFFICHFSFTNASELPPIELQKTLTFKHEFQNFTLPLAKYPEFLIQESGHSVDEKDFCEWSSKLNSVISSEVEQTNISDINSDVDSDSKGMTKPENKNWILDEEKFRDFVAEFILPKLEREAENVRIFRDEEGNISFDGVGIDGKKIDFEKFYAAANLALQSDFPPIEIPVLETFPEVTVDDPELQKMGVHELLAVGESDFSGSTWARMHNIETGKNRFDGVLIPQGETFSFNDNLGAVNAATGYLPELVIVGPKLEKEYGGGLCQVSSTTFRAALLAGLPIVERHNHSFAVHYYEPWGTDATIYLGGKNLRFENDTPGAIVIQTTMNRETKTLRFHFYGTRDERIVRLFGPAISNRVGPLPSKVETSEKLAPGEKLALSHAVPGFDAVWSRVVLPAKDFSPSQAAYSFFSRYEPRAEWTLIGAESSGDSEGSEG